jgi:hypothetical protein
MGSSSRFAAVTVLLSSILGMLYFQTKFSYYATILISWSLLVVLTAFFMIN